ncbi:hypothetical protein HYW43_03890, partial [Candidatus Daviesbacteria bacterium]|nr:hypothetical protein [Candidatus Daviesbacteria bacterium]
MPTSKGFAHFLLLIALAVIALMLIGIPLFVSTIILPNIKRETAGEFPKTFEERKEFIDKNSEPWVQNQQGMKYMGFEVPTSSELQDFRKSTDLTRRYPTSLKAIFDPGHISNTVDLLYYSDELADLGVNTFWVIGEYRI